MGVKVRTCDGRCHNARLASCRCWCGGLFHGESGEAAREAFRNAMGVPGRDGMPALEDPADFRCGGLVLKPQFPAAIEIAQAVRVRRIAREVAAAGGLACKSSP